jgi:hypothetical protein
MDRTWLIMGAANHPHYCSTWLDPPANCAGSGMLRCSEKLFTAEFAERSRRGREEDHKLTCTEDRGTGRCWKVGKSSLDYSSDVQGLAVKVMV